MKNFQIKNKKINNSSKTFIIAEIGINHEGSFEKCKKMIAAAKHCGADAIKLQTIDPNLNYHPSTKSFKEFKRTNFNRNQLSKLISYTKKKGIIFLSTPGTFDEVDLLKTLGCNGLKISSGQLTNLPLIKHASNTNLPIIISTGMAYEKEIRAATKFLKKSNYAILQCTSLYPNPDEYVNLNGIIAIQKKFKCLVGFSDHTKDWLSCVAAVAKGAKIIEKHFTFDQKRKGKDHHISLEPKEFQKMCQGIRRVEKMFGKEKIQPSTKEIPLRKLYHRTLVATKKIKIGEKFTKKNLHYARPAIYFQSSDLKKLLGKKSKKKYKIGHSIQ